jgi:hypothetical protein
MIEMKSKKGFSLEQHEQIAHDLKVIRDRLLKMVVHINKHYPLPIANKAVKAETSIDRLRDLLEREFYKEYHGLTSDERGKVYYPGGDFSNEALSDGGENE